MSSCSVLSRIASHTDKSTPRLRASCGLVQAHFEVPNEILAPFL